MLWSVPEAEQTTPTVQLSHILETWTALSRPEGKLTFAVSSRNCPPPFCPCPPLLMLCDQEVSVLVWNSYKAGCNLPAVSTGNCYRGNPWMHSAVGFWFLPSGGRMSHEDRRAEKVLLGKVFNWGWNLFWVWQYCFFFGEISNGTALFCVGFVQLGRWRPLQQGIYALRIRQVPGEWRDVGAFQLHYFDTSKSGSVVPSPEWNYAPLEAWQKSVFLIDSHPVFATWKSQAL